MPPVKNKYFSMAFDFFPSLSNTMLFLCISGRHSSITIRVLFILVMLLFLANADTKVNVFIYTLYYVIKKYFMVSESIEVVKNCLVKLLKKYYN